MDDSNERSSVCPERGPIRASSVIKASRLEKSKRNREGMEEREGFIGINDAAILLGSMLTHTRPASATHDSTNFFCF